MTWDILLLYSSRDMCVSVAVYLTPYPPPRLTSRKLYPYFLSHLLQVHDNLGQDVGFYVKYLRPDMAMDSLKNEIIRSQHLVPLLS